MEFALKSHACRAVGGRRKVVSFLVGQVLLRICTEKSLLQGAWRPTESRFCGNITAEWSEAVSTNGFRTFMGDNAREQPGSLQDVLLHETSVSWLRKRLEQSTPKKCWEETREAYSRRLKRCCDDINKDYDVEGLCRGFPKRIKMLTEIGGDRLKH